MTLSEKDVPNIQVQHARDPDIGCIDCIIRIKGPTEDTRPPKGTIIRYIAEGIVLPG